MKRLLILILSLAAFAGVAYAHNGMVHVMGTVTAFTENNVTVKATDGKTQTVTLAPTTKYTKGDAAATRQEIKVGQHVVIHATKKGEQLVAAEVKFAPMAGMGDMKGMHGDMRGMDMSSGSKKH